MLPTRPRGETDMGTISLRNLGLLASAPLFQNINLVLGDTDRLGIVAPNGGGKSSLLRCIAGERAPDEGEVVLSRGLRLPSTASAHHLRHVEQEGRRRLQIQPHLAHTRHTLRQHM
jgi:ATPase subunit of ABC transporter with duplicated ATPase domains